MAYNISIQPLKPAPYIASFSTQELRGSFIGRNVQILNIHKDITII